MVMPPACADLEQAERAVPAHAGQQAGRRRTRRTPLATDSNSTSTEGRQECRSGSSVRRRRPSRTTRCRPPGAMMTRPVAEATGAPSFG